MSELSGSTSANGNGNNSSSTKDGMDGNRLASIIWAPKRSAPGGAIRRLETIFRREGVPWVKGVEQGDQHLLGNLGHQVDRYFRTEDYVRDFGHRHHLLVLGDLMQQYCAVPKIAKKIKDGYAVRLNADAFNAAAWAKHDAAV
jgi:hypothetical protein